jgi:hypothetical protein
MTFAVCREIGMHTFHDITLWNECVHGLLAEKANGCGALASALAGLDKDVGSTFLGSKLAIEEDGALPDRAKEGGMLAEESNKFPAGNDYALCVNKECIKLHAEEERALAVKAKDSSEFLAEKRVALAEECSKLRAEEERALAEKTMWPNWPSSFINWNYEKNFDKEMAEAEAFEQANDLDEGELKARLCQGA